jgi:hypothetical protein
MTTRWLMNGPSSRVYSACVGEDHRLVPAPPRARGRSSGRASCRSVLSARVAGAVPMAPSAEMAAVRTSSSSSPAASMTCSLPRLRCRLARPPGPQTHVRRCPRSQSQLRRSTPTGRSDLSHRVDGSRLKRRVVVCRREAQDLRDLVVLADPPIASTADRRRIELSASSPARSTSKSRTRSTSSSRTRRARGSRGARRLS